MSGMGWNRNIYRMINGAEMSVRGVATYRTSEPVTCSQKHTKNALAVGLTGL